MVTYLVTMWPEKSLGSLYAKLYQLYDRRAFTLKEVVPLVGSYSSAKVYLYRLRMIGWVHRMAFEGKVWFRVCSPEVCVLQAAGVIKNLRVIKQQEYCRVIGKYVAKVLKDGLKVKSVVLYGSVARGCAKKDSDIDLFIVMDEEPKEVWNILIKHELSRDIEEEIEWLASNGIYTHITVLPMSVKRLKMHPFILLDIVDEGMVLHDDGTYEIEARKIKEKLLGLGAKRRFLSEDEWYWDLKPSYKPGEVIEI